MKITLLFFTISCGFILNAQPFFGLPTQNASWIESYYQINNPQSANLIFKGDIKYFVNGDTSLNNTIYHKIYKDTSGQIKLAFLFRNDTLNQKVKCRFVNENIEHLLFNFNVNIGDTLSDIVMGYNNPNIQNNKLIVKKIDSILINNQYHKRIKLLNIYSSDISNQPYYIVWIDGFGNLSSGGILGSTGLLSYYPRFVTCFEQNAQYFSSEPYDNQGYLFYNDSISSSNSCNFNPLSLKNDVQELNITIYPNPVNNFVSIEFPELIEKEIRIYNADGQLIYYNRRNENKIVKIDFSNYDIGVYFITVIFNDYLLTKKILKI